MKKFVPETVNHYSYFRVVIELSSSSNDINYRWSKGSEEKYRDLCVKSLKDVLEQVKRHVDGGESSSIDYDTQKTCVYCDGDPESDPSTGEPQCCNRAVIDFDKWQETADPDADGPKEKQGNIADNGSKSKE